MCPWDTVELESTERVQVVEERLEESITSASTTPNSKSPFRSVNLCAFSHPGHFGKCGIRQFHFKRNWKHCPTINTDKLWTLVSEQTRTAANKDKAPVIDVTKSVSPLFESSPVILRLLIIILL